MLNWVNRVVFIIFRTHLHSTRVSLHFWWQVLTVVQPTQWWKVNGDKEAGLPATLDPQRRGDVDQHEYIDVWDRLEKDFDVYNDPTKVPDS